MICHILGVGTNICENGNLLEISAIHINNCKMGARNNDINLARGKMKSEMINIIPIIKQIPKIGLANKLEIKKVNEMVLKWYIIMGIITKLAAKVTIHISLTLCNAFSTNALLLSVNFSLFILSSSFILCNFLEKITIPIVPPKES